MLGIDYGDPWDIRTFSGSSRYLWSEFRRQGVLVDAFTPYPSRPLTMFYKARAFHPNMRRWRARWRRSLPFRKCLSARAVRKILRNYRGAFNASLQIGAYYNLAAALDCPRGLLADGNCALSQRTYATYQTSDAIFRKQREFERAVYRSMDRVFCFSRFLAQSMIDDFGCAPERVKVVGAGINIDETLIRNPERNYGAKTILFSAFDWVHKGGPVLLEAFEKVKREAPEARLILLGPTLTGLPQGVICHGPLSKDQPQQLQTLGEAFRSASIFVHPTLADAFPNVIREAMAAGLPCVASDIGSIPEMVTEGQTGYLVPKGNAAQLADRVLRLLANPGLAQAMGEAGYARYRERFTWARVCATIVDELGQVPAERSTGAWPADQTMETA
ncbi:MAG: glycosyltransferase family 4 protein, partial [candidate division Zixibacteria bacterium]|nr:glycosyltransferase family 4 protein [candidate division Zixibacteria bacterium]